MSDSLNKYQAFSGIRTVNLAESGATAEELKTQGNPDPRPVAAPDIRSERLADIRDRLAVDSRTSDQMGNPQSLPENPYEGQRRMLVDIRGAIRKLRSATLKKVRAKAQDQRQKVSVGRLLSMDELASDLAGMAEQVLIMKDGPENRSS